MGNMSQLPAYMRGGQRSAFAGPIAGGLVCYTVTQTQDEGNSQTDAIIGASCMMTDFRLLAVSWDVFTSDSTCVLTIEQNTTAAVGGTNLLSSTVNLTATPTGYVTAVGTTPTLTTTLEDRSVSRGDYIVASVTTGAGGLCHDLQLWFWGYTTGHCNVLPAND